MGVRLPSAYQEVEYLEATGTQIIDTDYLPVGGDEMSIELSFSSYPPRGTFYCFAATDNSDPQVQLVFGTETSGKTLFYKYFSTGDARKLRTNFAVDTIYRIDVAANGDCTCNGVTVSPLNNLGYATGHLRFFARMAGNVNFYGRLYKFVASHDGIEKVNLVPCYRKSDSEPGMYDLVYGTFFTNAGTGEFVVGPDVIDSISPWLVARRRLLMRKPKLDTSPRIAQYGYGLSRSNTGITEVEANCYTEWYDVDPVATYQRTMTGSGVASGGANGSCFQTQTATGGGNWDYFTKRNLLHANSAKIRFTLVTSQLANCYVYCNQSGQIFFAGKNTPYYGYTNINDMPTGT